MCIDLESYTNHISLPPLTGEGAGVGVVQRSFAAFMRPPTLAPSPDRAEGASPTRRGEGSELTIIQRM